MTAHSICIRIPPFHECKFRIARMRMERQMLKFMRNVRNGMIFCSRSLKRRSNLSFAALRSICCFIRRLNAIDEAHFDVRVSVLFDPVRRALRGRCQRFSEPVENGSVFTEIGPENRRSGSIKAKNGSEIGVFGSDFISSPGLAVPFLLPAKKT